MYVCVYIYIYIYIWEACAPRCRVRQAGAATYDSFLNYKYNNILIFNSSNNYSLLFIYHLILLLCVYIYIYIYIYIYVYAGNNLYPVPKLGRLRMFFHDDLEMAITMTIATITIVTIIITIINTTYYFYYYYYDYCYYYIFCSWLLRPQAGAATDVLPRRSRDGHIRHAFQQQSASAQSNSFIAVCLTGSYHIVVHIVA